MRTPYDRGQTPAAYGVSHAYSDMVQLVKTWRRLVKSLIALAVIVWLLIGAVAAAQRDYFSGKRTNCATLSTTALTIVSGPLNYMGANPKTKCPKLPQPSK